ncbi:hypothetical protein QQX98_008313 [Neonectria punicea]|uniref:Uncharacterized protein n=1 Tax=Neonectria punicea TaxID=979145 RepID=A0ABR1GVS4_9HYPO
MKTRLAVARESETLAYVAGKNLSFQTPRHLWHTEDGYSKSRGVNLGLTLTVLEPLDGPDSENTPILPAETILAPSTGLAPESFEPEPSDRTSEALSAPETAELDELQTNAKKKTHY